jgi:hypothetical protein
MRTERSPVSAHQHGMSALWHDADYLPEQRFETPVVRLYGLEDLALPAEEHQLPDGVDDPFHKLDAVFEIAAQQMERGLKGTAFLHGKPPPIEADPTRLDDDLVRNNTHGPRKGTAADQKIIDSIRADFEQVRLTNQAIANTIPKTKGASETAAERDASAQAPNAAGGSDALATVATFVPMAAGIGLQSAVQGPLPALATQALTVVGGAAGAAQATLAGVAEGLAEDAPVVVRRGLSNARKKV